MNLRERLHEPGIDAVLEHRRIDRCGIAFGLVGEGDGARAMLRRCAEWFESDEDLEWRVDEDRDLYERVRVLIELAQDGTELRRQIRRDLRQARSLLKLDADADVPF